MAGQPRQPQHGPAAARAGKLRPATLPFLHGQRVHGHAAAPGAAPSSLVLSSSAGRAGLLCTPPGGLPAVRAGWPRSRAAGKRGPRMPLLSTPRHPGEMCVSPSPSGWACHTRTHTHTHTCPSCTPPPLQLVHEVAHAVVAGSRGIKLAPSFLIPNSQLGTFGSVTQVGRWFALGVTPGGTGGTLPDPPALVACCLDPCLGLGCGCQLSPPPRCLECCHPLRPPRLPPCPPAAQVHGAHPHRPVRPVGGGAGGGGAHLHGPLPGGAGRLPRRRSGRGGPGCLPGCLPVRVWLLCGGGKVGGWVGGRALPGLAPSRGGAMAEAGLVVCVSCVLVPVLRVWMGVPCGRVLPWRGLARPAPQSAPHAAHTPSPLPPPPLPAPPPAARPAASASAVVPGQPAVGRHRQAGAGQRWVAPPRLCCACFCLLLLACC